MATAPVPGASRRVQEDDTASFKVNGKTYSLRFSSITAKLVSECRKTTGFTPAQLFGAMANVATLDLDVVAAMIWLASRQAGDEVDYDAVLDDVTYEWLATFEPTEDDAPEDPDSPEA